MELLSVTINDGVVPRSQIEGKDNSSEDKHNYKIVLQGDMVYNSMRMWQGASGISLYDGIVSPAYTVLMPKCPINNEYFAALFKTHNSINKFRKNSQGMTSDTWNLKYPQIETIKIYIPRLSEQNKISSFLNRLNKRIEKQRTLVETLKRYKRGLLSKLFPRKGQTTPELRFAGFTEPWKQYKVKDLFKITRGYVLATSMTSDKRSENMPYPVYSSQTKNDGLMGYYKDFLYENAITWTTDGANAGTVNFRAGKFYCTNVCGVLLADKAIPNQMISEALNSVAKNHVSYVGNPKLMNNVMAEIPISLPESEEERQTISSIFACFDRRITNHQWRLDEIQVLKFGLLQQLFI